MLDNAAMLSTLSLQSKCRIKGKATWTVSVKGHATSQ